MFNQLYQIFISLFIIINLNIKIIKFNPMINLSIIIIILH